MNGVLLLVRGASPQREDLVGLARRLAEKVAQSVVVSSLEDPIRAIRSLAGQGVLRIVVLPLLLTTDQQETGLAPAIRLSSQRWPFLTFHLARPPSLVEWADVICPPAQNRPLIISAPSSGDPGADSNLAALAWLVGRHGHFPRVVGALNEDASSDALVVPWLRADHPRLADCLAKLHHEAAQDESFLPRSYNDIEQRINEILPPQYQGNLESVSAQPMGSADLLMEDGEVAWDRMWTTFCDLALAGGPSHRDTLLEAVPSSQVAADLPGYAKVVAEIERGIALVTGLPTVTSPVPGWVGVRCHAPEMAIWLIRAIIVENVMVRREAEVLYLPAAPHFRLEGEIKNVVTVVAKTFHYWTEHQRKL